MGSFHGERVLGEVGNDPNKFEGVMVLDRFIGIGQGHELGGGQQQAEETAVRQLTEINGHDRLLLRKRRCLSSGKGVRPVRVGSCRWRRMLRIKLYKRITSSRLMFLMHHKSLIWSLKNIFLPNSSASIQGACESLQK